jgi:hypothetical protein
LQGNKEGSGVLLVNAAMLPHRHVPDLKLGIHAYRQQLQERFVYNQRIIKPTSARREPIPTNC